MGESLGESETSYCLRLLSYTRVHASVHRYLFLCPIIVNRAHCRTLIE